MPTPMPAPDRQVVVVVARSGQRYTHPNCVSVESRNDAVEGRRIVVTSLLPNGDGTTVASYHGAESLSFHPRHLPPG